MLEKNIVDLFINHRSYEAEVGVLLDCTSHSKKEKYTLAARRIALVNHWLSYASMKEQRILLRHLIDGISWMKLSDENRNQNIFPFDVRSLQRLQKKAIRKIYNFTLERFGNSLDYLIDPQFHENDDINDPNCR